MICKNCKASIPDDSMFCPSCGQKVEAESVVTPAPTFSSAFRQAGSLDDGDSGIGAPVVESKPIPPREESGLRFSPSFKRPGGLTAEDSPEKPVVPPMAPAVSPVAPPVTPAVKKCPHCGGPLDSDAVFCNYCGKKLDKPLARKVGKKLGGVNLPKFPKKGIIATGSIALVLAVVLLLGFVTNWFGVVGPAAQIAAAVKNTLTAKNFTVDYEFSVVSTGEGSEVSRGTAYISIDPKARELTYYSEQVYGGVRQITAVYKGCYILRNGNRVYGYAIDDELDSFFDSYDEQSSMDLAEFLDTVINEAELDSQIDCAEFERGLKSYFKDLNNRKWLEEYAGYSVEKEDGVTKHCFSPDLYEFAKRSAGYFKAAFTDRNFYYEMEDAIADLNNTNTDVSVVIGVKDGKFVHIRGQAILHEYGGVVHADAEFYNFGKTKFDTNELDDLLAQVK